MGNLSDHFSGGGGGGICLEHIDYYADGQNYYNNKRRYNSSK